MFRKCFTHNRLKTLPSYNTFSNYEISRGILLSFIQFKNLVKFFSIPNMFDTIQSYILLDFLLFHPCILTRINLKIDRSFLLNVFCSFLIRVLILVRPKNVDSQCASVEILQVLFFLVEILD